MILVWNNMNSFKRHLEDMRHFRQSHDDWKTELEKMFKDMPTLFNVKPPQETGTIRSITDDNGTIVFVPIWKITPARGLQN